MKRRGAQASRCFVCAVASVSSSKRAIGIENMEVSMASMDVPINLPRTGRLRAKADRGDEGRSIVMVRHRGLRTSVPSRRGIRGRGTAEEEYKVWLRRSSGIKSPTGSCGRCTSRTSLRAAARMVAAQGCAAGANCELALCCSAGLGCASSM